MHSPVAVLQNGVLTSIVTQPVQFISSLGVLQPAEAWSLWTAEDWAAQCPGLTIVPLIDPAPSDPAYRYERLPESEWRVMAEAVEVTYSVTPRTAAEIDAEAAARLSVAAGTAIARINAEAGTERARYITVTTGQEGTYLAKQAEAERYDVGGAGPFPYLEAEAAATGVPVADVAAMVAATAAQWTGLNAAIEGARRGALVAVERAVAAGDVAALEAVFPVAWPGAGA